MMGRLIGKRGQVTILAILLAGLVWVAPASANSPWWHLSSATRPTFLRTGNARNEIQKLTVSATEGRYRIEEENAPLAKEAVLSVGESPEQVQEALEGMFGKGEVRVTGEAGANNPYETYEIEFVGELSDYPVDTIEVPIVRVSGGNEEVTVTEIAKGSYDGVIVVTAANLGDAPINAEVSPVTITDRLPAGLRAVKIEGFADEIVTTGNSTNPLECHLGTLSCTFNGKGDESPLLGPFIGIQVRINVRSVGAKSGEVNEATVTGGGARDVTAKQPITVSNNEVPFGVNTYEMRPEEDGGGVDTQAGSHPFQYTTTLMFNETLEGGTPQLAKDLHFKLPTGFIGNPTPIAQCPLGQFLSSTGNPQEGESGCSTATVLGVAKVLVHVHGFTDLAHAIIPFTRALFNLEPAVGEPARFGFIVEGIPVILDTAVRTGEDYGVTVNVTNITQAAEFVGSEVTFWGVPGDPRHNDVRGEGCLTVAAGHTFTTCPSFEEHHYPPFLELPTSCAGPLETSMEADSWREPANVLMVGQTEPMPALDGCNRLHFDPSISVTPDGQAGSTPTGLAVAVHVPQDVSLNPEGLSEADVKNTTVALPEGVGLNPAGADGLESCTESQVALNSHGPSTCPAAAKVGLVKIKTPLLPHELEGAAYLASQDANPFGSLVALYVVAEDPVSGTTVKLAGEVVPDPLTGRLVSTFKNTPQLPFETFELHFFGGDRAPLSTPSLCGAYTTTAAIEPWTDTGEVDSNSTFDVTSGPNGTQCHTPLPFSPSLTAGTTSIQAGGFSPFTMTMSRPDGSQNLQAIKLTMPPGLLGTLATVKLCKEAQANTGTCGPETLIGHTTVSVGVGGDPYTVTGGEVFITEGYEGAPYGLSIVNPAKAGPFDLGKVIVRAKIEVNPLTAALTITTDNTGPYKIPTILDGIPLQIQHVEVSVDRANFTFNPTNCSPLQVGGNLYSSEGSSTAVKVPFQITNCAVLAFKPKLTAKTAGKTSRKSGASLSVKLTYPAGPYDANIAKVKVDLPKQLPSRLTTLQKACPAATFEANPAACPPASIVGHATATTPVLPVPLTGPAYFVSHAGEEFPSLIIVLQGYGTMVHLVGTTFINNKTNITSSTFKSVPDVPVGTFELTLPQGPYSALAATTNLCTTKLTMPTSFTGQNGAEIHTTTPITPTGCTKHKTTKKKNKKANHKGTTHKKKK